MRLARTAALAALVVAAAVWAAWPAPAREGVRFALPESLDLEFPEGGTQSNVVCTAGRVIANRTAVLVFRWLVDPVAIEITAPQGAFQLRLAPPGQAAWVTGDGRQLTLLAADGTVQALPLPDGPPSRVRLSWSDGAYRVQLDGREAGAVVATAPPPGPAALQLRQGASIAALDCETADGISRHVEGEPPPPGFERTAWAGLAALVGLLCLAGWWAALRGRRPPVAARAAGLLSCGALVIGLPLAFLARNAPRGEAPEPCATEVLEQREARPIEPGRPWTLTDRRDGDFDLAAEVVLAEATAVDVLLRAGLPRIDRQLLVTLSSDPALPSGVGRNLGTFLETEPAEDGLAVLPAGRLLRLEIECRDDRLQATVDGRPLGAVRDLDLRAGATALHALSGSATISGLRLSPSGPPRALSGGLASRALLVGAGTLLALLLLAGPGGLRWAATLWIWPLATVVPPLVPDEAPWLGACAAVLLVLPLVVRVAGGRLAAGLSAAAALALVAVSLWALRERPAVISPAILNLLRNADVAGEPVPAAYAWARHPLCRRFNPYLRSQQFRERQHTLAKPPDRLRVVALGSSSTYGYGVTARDAWAARLEELLERAGTRAEVINAGVPGATAERLRWFLGGVVLPLDPDVVVVDLSFNDRSISGVADERAHFRAMTTRGIGQLERLFERWAAARRDRAYGAFVQGLDGGREVPAADRERFSLAPARRFQESLRDMAAACREAGVALVLVQEPRRAGPGSVSLADYHAAIAELGRELGLPVVSPQAPLDAAKEPVFLDAVHPTAAGHRIIALTVAAALAEAGLAGR